MARELRVFEPNRVYHVFNRRTDRQLLFPSPNAFDEFLHLMGTACKRYEIRICTYCLMDTHWHQAIWVREKGATSVVRYLQWLSSQHARTFRVRTGTRGNGHVYQDRYKSLPIQDDAHYFRVLRYIEANPLAAGLVDRAEYWPWSGAAERVNRRRQILQTGPAPLPANWLEVVNAYCETADEGIPVAEAPSSL